MAVPYTFGSATSSIPLSQLDSNFATTITLGNTAIQLGNTVTTLNNMTLANVTVQTGNVTIGQANAVVYTNSSNVATANASLIAFDGTNLGLGVTPSAWGSSFKALQMSYATMMNASSGGYFGSNFYYNSSGNPIYVNNGYALAYSAYSAGGAHLLLTAPSGTAGGAITWTTSMTLEKGKSLALEGATSQTGIGITFPATQSNSPDPNTLDDYEDGTWTPSIQGNATYTTQTGYYTKIGRFVSATFEIQINSQGTGNVLTIAGLPFVGANGNGQGGSIGYFSGAANNFYFVSLRVDNGQSSILLASTTSATGTTNTSTAFFTSGTRLLGTVNYLTS